VSRAKQLTMGADSSSPTPDEERERKTVLRATVETYLPEFARGVEAS
jgi:DNA-directed RNA polymerase subunit K/omega